MYGLEEFVGKHPVRNARSEIEVIETLWRRPLTKSVLVRVGMRFGLSVKQLARIYGVTPRTHKMISSRSVLSDSASAHVVQLAKLYYTGVKIFGSHESFISWINRETFALENIRPIDLLTSILGIELVRDEMSRMKHGIPP